MDFGRVTTAQLNRIDFQLPEEPVLNRAVLTGVPAAQPKLFLGGTQWGLKSWVGTLYPAGTRPDQMLPAYARQFNCVELNATHYKIHPPTTMRQWKEKAGDTQFRFCPKLYQPITHEKTLNEHDDLLAAFLESAAALEENLGPIFLQLSERFAPSRAEELYTFLENLPAAFTFFVEVRHPAWFQPPVQQAYFRTLHQLNKGAVITDVAGRRDVCHMHLTMPKTFVRFVGNGLHPTDFARVDAWAGRLAHWLQQGLEEAYFILHMPDEATVPQLARYVTERFNEGCGAALKPLDWFQPPQLF